MRTASTSSAARSCCRAITCARSKLATRTPRYASATASRSTTSRWNAARTVCRETPYSAAAASSRRGAPGARAPLRMPARTDAATRATAVAESEGWDEAGMAASARRSPRCPSTIEVGSNHEPHGNADGGGDADGGRDRGDRPLIGEAAEVALRELHPAADLLRHVQLVFERIERCREVGTGLLRGDAGLHAGEVALALGGAALRGLRGVSRDGHTHPFPSARRDRPAGCRSTRAARRPA